MKNKVNYYADKIIKDGIKDTWSGNIIIDSSNYNDIEEYKEQVLKQIIKDKRVADAVLDEDGNFNIVFYTDYCPNYEPEELD